MCIVDICEPSASYWAGRIVCYQQVYTYVNGYETDCEGGLSTLKWNAYLPEACPHDCNLRYCDYKCWDGYVDPETVWISNPWWHNAIKYVGKIDDKGSPGNRKGVWVAHEMLIADTYSNRAWSTRPIPCTSSGCEVTSYTFGSTPTVGTCYVTTCKDCNLDNASTCTTKLYDRNSNPVSCS